jgi:hypothetical protein
MYLGMGADAKAIGSDLQQNDFRQVQNAGENRIAVASGVPSSMLGISEGIKGAALSGGNFQEARRNFTDTILMPLWGSACAALQTIVKPPSGGPARLWYDIRDIPFLKEDQKDAATILQQGAATMAELIMNGAVPESAQAAVVANDFSLLKWRPELSVQLHPGTGKPSGGTATNGSGNGSPTVPAQLGAGK